MANQKRKQVYISKYLFYSKAMKYLIGCVSGSLLVTLSLVLLASISVQPAIAQIDDVEAALTPAASIPPPLSALKQVSITQTNSISFSPRGFLNRISALTPLPIMQTDIIEPNLFSPQWISTEANDTHSLAWGDVDGDGDLDLAVGNSDGANRLYLNNNGVISSTAVWSSDEADSTNSLAWGDVDRDGDLDLVVGNGKLFPLDETEGQPNRLYLNERNQDGMITLTLVWTSTEVDLTTSLAWGDVDGDGDLDLVAGNYAPPDGQAIGQYNRIYRNDNGSLTTSGVWTSTIADLTLSVAWADVDDDGKLDLAVGNGGSLDQGILGQHNYIYKNISNLDEIALTQVWTSTEEDFTVNLAWGDYNNDGAPDLAVANGGIITGQQNRIYYNTGITLETTAIFSFTEIDGSASIAWGDVDGDGDLDLAIGNSGTVAGSIGGESNYIYRNDGLAIDGRTPIFTPIWSSAETDFTISVAWGDYDDDGILDLAIGNANHPNGQQNRIYRNERIPLKVTSDWASGEDDYTFGMAWGDYDGDGFIDLAVADYTIKVKPNGDLQEFTPTLKLYHNNFGELEFDPAWNPVEFNLALSFAWGDVDNDGDLDLAVGNACLPIQSINICMNNRLYLYDKENNRLEDMAAWNDSKDDDTSSLVWGDVDGDGDLDLAAGNYGQPNRLYRNDSEPGIIKLTPVWASMEEQDLTWSLAWGDVDGDGDLDLAAGNKDQPNRLYLNNNGMLTDQAIWNSDEVDSSISVAWGDVDGDGNLDLAVGNVGQSNRIYRNDGDMLSNSPIWSSLEVDSTTSMAWGDVDSDGDLDLVVGNGGSSFLDFPRGQPNRVYRNDGVEGDGLTPILNLVWSSHEADSTINVAWADVDNDGDLDLAVGNLGGPYVDGRNRLYRNFRDARPSPTPPPTVYLARPAPPPNANFYSTPEIWYDPTISISYTLSHPESHPVKSIRAFYSLNGGGHWLPAVATNTITQNLQTSPVGVSHAYTWDTFASGVFGQNDNVVFRIEAIPTITTTQPNSIPGPYLYGVHAFQTFPFRVRGTQVRVVDENNQPVQNALVYRLPGGQPIGGIETPFQTSSQGYLLGRGTLNQNDQLIALLPIRQTDKYILYHTSATPTMTGLDTFTITQSGVQTLAVSADNPLLFLDLDVSLEWDASNDETFRTLLEQNLAKVSAALYDWTNGQVALGRVTVYQAKEHWDEAEVRIFASNQMRPIANRGGIVTQTTALTFTKPLTFSPGEIRLGPTWNRYGDPEPIGDDWPNVLAHELGHYALFLEDTYLKLDEDTGLLVPIDTCTGTAMSDPYDEISSEFRYRDDDWDGDCGPTLAEMSDWEIIDLVYPALHQPPPINNGPTTIPFAFTQIETKVAPSHPAPLLDDENIPLDDSLLGGRAYLVHPDEGLIDLGQPILNSVLARGAHEDDELCVFAATHFACSSLSNGAPPQLNPQIAWQPEILLTPINTTTLQIRVDDGSSNPLTVTLYPNGEEPQTEVLNSGNEETFILYQPALEVLVDIQGTGPDQRIMTGYAAGSGPGRARSHGGPGRARSHGGPFSSGDGSVIIYPPQNLPDDIFIVLQLASTLPELPPGLTGIGRAYQVRPSAPVTDPTGGSLTFQYLGLDVLIAGGPQGEESLAVHHWDGNSWTRLETKLNKIQNFASAPLLGPGLYALTVGQLTPKINNVSPPSGVSGLVHTLTITGNNFLPPLTAILHGNTGSYSLTVISTNPQTIEVQTLKDLPADLYDLELTNAGGLTDTLFHAFALNTDLPANACFFEDFKSGLNQWTISGDWDIVTLSDGREAVTDSPGNPYSSADKELTLTTTITSQNFNLASCSNPVLSFQHDYELVIHDWITVEISTDNGATWQSLVSFTGQEIQRLAATLEDEWNPNDLQTVTLDLAEAGIPVNTMMALLRFKLVADDFASAKGWVIDEVVIASGKTPIPPNSNTYLPLITNEQQP